VLDPFFGTGTTGAVAKRLGRDFIGIERDPGYAARAEERLAGIQTADPDLIIHSRARRDEPRIPFGSIVERGWVTPGAVLYSQQRKWSARVRPDGRLTASDTIGSIHQVGALVQGAPACNGWTFWHLEVKGQLVALDVLRQRARAELN